jgi:ribosomal-protein-alanine N-acetyltransferase
MSSDAILDTVIRLERLGPSHAEEMFAAAERSRALHRPWVELPATRAAMAAHLAAPDTVSVRYGVREPGGALAGVVNLNAIIRGLFDNAFLGFYAMEPYAGRGLMRAGLRAVVERAFGEHELHRVEANVQPDNERSVRLVRALGFRLEGRSPRYLRIAGAWRDHDRYALTVEDWSAGARP